MKKDGGLETLGVCLWAVQQLMALAVELEWAFCVRYWMTTRYCISWSSRRPWRLPREGFAVMLRKWRALRCMWRVLFEERHDCRLTAACACAGMRVFFLSAKPSAWPLWLVCDSLILLALVQFNHVTKHSVRECTLSFCAESFVFQFDIKKCKD